MEPELRPIPDSDHDENLFKTESNESKHVSIMIKSDITKTDGFDKLDDELSSGEFSFSEKTRRSGRLAIFLVCIAFLIIGRYSVPDNEVKCVEDKIITALQFANDFINTRGNEYYRDFFQALCSLMVDATFIITFGYWVLRGTGGRLPVTLAVFYVTRALVQKVWYSPYPEGFYWNSPGIPSLVVPYGRGSDFFFSGHSGFMVICASEWHKLKIPKIRNFVIFAAVYTILILLTYRIHYSIDVFTGVFFAEWCFCKVDLYKDYIDTYWTSLLHKVRSLLGKKQCPITFMGQEMISLSQQD